MENSKIISGASTETDAINEMTTQKQSTTDLSLKTGVIMDPGKIVSNLEDYLHLQDPHSIVTFLKKPIFIQSVTWSTSDAINTILVALGPASTISPTAGYSMWTNKLNGIYSMKATAVYDVVLNATPFHAGGLLAYYLPCESSVPGLYSAHYLDLCGASQAPGATIVNVNQDHFQFKIPYIAPTEMFLLDHADNRFPDWGAFRIAVWSPLKVGASGSNNITLSIYMHWEDVQLGPAINQSGYSGRRMKARLIPIKDVKGKSKAVPTVHSSNCEEDESIGNQADRKSVV